MRNYRKEYDDYHGKPEQIANRAARNKARAELRPGPGKEVDHKKPLSKGGSNGRGNTRIVSRHTYRTKAAK